MINYFDTPNQKRRNPGEVRVMKYLTVGTASKARDHFDEYVLPGTSNPDCLSADELFEEWLTTTNMWITEERVEAAEDMRDRNVG